MLIFLLTVDGFRQFFYGFRQTANNIITKRTQARYPFLRKAINHKNKRMPFNMLDIVMLHQMPVRASAVWMSASAMGIRRAVNRMLTSEGGMVFPKPENAPAVIISTLMNSWDTPKITR